MTKTIKIYKCTNTNCRDFEKEIDETEARGYGFFCPSCRSGKYFENGRYLEKSTKEVSSDRGY